MGTDDVGGYDLTKERRWARLVDQIKWHVLHGRPEDEACCIMSGVQVGFQELGCT